MKFLAAVFVMITSGAAAQDMADAGAAQLRLLDKLTGEIFDLTLSRGQSKSFGRLTVQMDDCRYYPDAPAADAIVHMTILDVASQDPVFNGWMTAASPALSALDHPRYDVWPLRCDVADLVLPEVDEAPASEDTTDGEGEGG